MKLFLQVVILPVIVATVTSLGVVYIVVFNGVSPNEIDSTPKVVGNELRSEQNNVVPAPNASTQAEVIAEELIYDASDLTIDTNVTYIDDQHKKLHEEFIALIEESQKYVQTNKEVPDDLEMRIKKLSLELQAYTISN